MESLPAYQLKTGQICIKWKGDKSQIDQDRSSLDPSISHVKRNDFDEQKEAASSGADRRSVSTDLVKTGEDYNFRWTRCHVEITHSDGQTERSFLGEPHHDSSIEVYDLSEWTASILIAVNDSEPLLHSSNYDPPAKPLRLGEPRASSIAVVAYWDSLTRSCPLESRATRDRFQI